MNQACITFILLLREAIYTTSLTHTERNYLNFVMYIYGLKMLIICMSKMRQETTFPFTTFKTI